MLGDYLNRVYRLLISRRFAIILLIVISVLLLLGILLPNLAYHEPEEMHTFQQNHPVLFKLGETFYPPTLVTSYTFLILTSLLMLSTLLCAIERIRNREYQDPYGPEPKFFRSRVEFTIKSKPDAVLKTANTLLKRKWWARGTPRRQEELLFLDGRKGAAGFWGSLIFHIGFLVILVGVIVSSATRFSGTVLIAEGQELPLTVGNITELYRKPAGGFELPGSILVLEKFTAKIVGEQFPVDYTADLSITESNGNTRRERIRVNEAIAYYDSAILLRNYGYAPRIIVKNKGKELVNAFFNIKGRTAGSRDNIPVPKSKLEIETIFFPNYSLTTSIKPTEPALNIRVKENGKKVFQGVLHRGKSVKFRQMSVAFPEMRHWAYFQINRDLGIVYIFFGFVISFIGIMLRFIFHDRQLSVRLKPVAGGTEVLLSGRSKYFPAFFKEELARLEQAIRSETTGV